MKGKIFEHITAQELSALNYSSLSRLSFWTSEKPDANAEVDYVYQHKGMIFPIEVKSGVSGRLRSLHQIIEYSNHPYCVRIYAGKFKIDHEKTISGKPYYLLNLPFFLINKLPEYLDWMMGSKK